MFKKFTRNNYDDLNRQHNIAIFVGHGFDISILNKYKSNKFPQRTTSYKDFFDYITFLGLPAQDNLIYKEMKEERSRDKANWSDFENIIHSLLLQEHNIDIEQLNENVKSFQEYFSRYLNELIDTSLLVKIDEDACKIPYFQQTFANFSRDLHTYFDDYSFGKSIGHNDLFNYVVFNFNYTFLLDNFIYPYQTQFNPHPYRTVDRNFSFNYYARGWRLTQNCSSYFNCDIIHPHGQQFIPKSIIFGTDLDENNYDASSGLTRTFIKSYWAQNDIKYKSYIEEAELFIIYGMSLGKTDAWWFDNIFDALLPKTNNESGGNCDAELIIYYKVQNANDDSQIDKVKDSFIDSCIRHKHSSNDNKEMIRNKIHVVLFENNDTYFLGLEKKKRL